MSKIEKMPFLGLQKRVKIPDCCCHVIFSVANKNGDLIFFLAIKFSLAHLAKSCKKSPKSVQNSQKVAKMARKHQKHPIVKSDLDLKNISKYL